MEFKINIGEKFVDEKRNLTIIDRELRPDKKGRMWKWYKYKCNNCGYDDGWNTEHHILNGIGCSCCRGFTVVKGINDVATTHPEYIKYFENIEDAYKITYSSKKKAQLKCPKCGTSKLMEMTQFHRYGLCCDKCGDGVSYPEKFMYSFLEQLKIKFVCQAGKKYFSWSDGVRYDFYLADYNCIIEVNGCQHYDGEAHYGFKSYEYELANDEYKKNLAKTNGIDNYFIIDCRKSTLDWIKHSIIDSGLIEFLEVFEGSIDWNKCQEFTTHSALIDVCTYKNNNPELSTSDISKVFGLARTTIQCYLQKGAELGICIYNKELEKDRGHKRAIKNRISNKKKKSA